MNFGGEHKHSDESTHPFTEMLLILQDQIKSHFVHLNGPARFKKLTNCLIIEGYLNWNVSMWNSIRKVGLSGSYKEDISFQPFYISPLETSIESQHFHYLRPFQAVPSLRQDKEHCFRMQYMNLLVDFHFCHIPKRDFGQCSWDAFSLWLICFGSALLVSGRIIS